MQANSGRCASREGIVNCLFRSPILNPPNLPFSCLMLVFALSNWCVLTLLRFGRWAKLGEDFSKKLRGSSLIRRGFTLSVPSLLLLRTKIEESLWILSAELLVDISRGVSVASGLTVVFLSTLKHTHPIYSFSIIIPPPHKEYEKE